MREVKTSLFDVLNVSFKKSQHTVSTTSTNNLGISKRLEHLDVVQLGESVILADSLS